MTDFFDDLERQLVTATQHRPQRLRRARARHAAALATVLVALLAGGAGLATALSNGGDAGRSVGAPATTTPAARTTTAPRTTPSQLRPFTVAILNGTTVPGLARGVATQLQDSHFKIGNITNTSRQDQAATMVHYAPGRQLAATLVASRIKLKDVVLRPITRDEQVLAGEQAAVVVVVGSDQNTSPAP
ncbi:MAG: LytR family transcriptional regulator [Conexibacter sp.]|nr:LytR family transcriptional regulator [Conexibacter sp.]